MKYINEIFSLLLDENVYKKFGINKRACYWKMGTSFFKMFDRLLKNIENIDISSPITSTYNPKNKTTQGNNPSYKLVINNINITPCKVRGYVSDAAIHQYMRVITSFGIGVIDKYYESYKDFVENNGQIFLVHNAKRLLEINNRIGLIKKVIVDAFFSNIQDTRNIAYSIILEFLFAKSFNFNNLNSNNRIFYWNKLIGRTNKKERKYANLITDLELIKKDIYRQGTIGTYKEIIDCLIKEYETVESFVNEIWFEYQYKFEGKNKIYDELIKTQIKKENILSLIKNERSKFKDNIFENRKQLGFINSKDELYSDLVEIDNTNNNLLAKFNEAEAAHIYDVYQIKRDIINNIDNVKLIKFVSNPNNGLIMKHEYHKSLDRNQWSFDANGNMIVPIENQDYLFNVLKLKKVKINPSIFNDEMKYFLNKR